MNDFFTNIIYRQLAAPDPFRRDPGAGASSVLSYAQRSRKQGWFEVITGKSVTAEGASKCFAFVNNYDSKPKRRLFEVLKSQGMQLNQEVTFLSDGADTVCDLQLYMNPNLRAYPGPVSYHHAADRNASDGKRIGTTGL
jgi:hypothetical protein